MAERRSYHTGRTLSREQVARLLYQAGFRGDAIWKLVAIAGRESSYDPGAHGTDQPRSANSGDRGLFQINSTHDDYLRQHGINPNNLFDPLTNAKAAYLLSSGGAEGALLGLWGADETGWVGANGDYLYGTDPTAAQAAYNNVRQAGWGPAAAGGGQPAGPPTMEEIARGLGNAGDPRYRQYATLGPRELARRAAAIRAFNGGIPAPAAPTEFFNWQEHPELNNQYNQASPHLEQFDQWLTGHFGGENLGIYDEREVSGGGAPSSHAFGAAFDFMPDSDADKQKIIDLITKYPGAFGIEAIHDYKNLRVWRLGREGDLGGGWQSQAPGSHGGDMGSAAHLHFEVTPQAYSKDGRRSWRNMQRAIRGKFGGDSPLTDERWGDIARKLGNRGNPMFEDYATISPRLLEQRQAAFSTRPGGMPPLPSETPAGEAASQALSTYLRKLGVRYPDAPMPTPALMAYLRGVGLSMDTAQDIRRRTVERVRINRRAALEDITRQAGRTKENITADLITRGVLSSGEANTRYTRHAEDVAAEQADVAREAAGSREAAQTAYQQALDQMHTGILEQVASTEEAQDITEATNRATARGYNRANRAAQGNADAVAEAQRQALQQLLGQLRRRNRQLRRQNRRLTQPSAPAPPPAAPAPAPRNPVRNPTNPR